MNFRRAVQRYGRTPLPETPYQRAGQLWDERIGSARIQARNWRLMAFGSLGLTAALSGGLLWQSLQSRVVPFVVEVDRMGEARAVAPADASYQPSDPQIAWFLGHFITDVRSVSLDPVLMKANWLVAYDFTTKRGAVFIGDYARQSDPFGQVGERTVSVQVTSIVRASDKSFQVKWIETAYERGAQAGVAHWTANPPWRPLRAFDDGRQTFIEFPASLSTGEAPPLFLVDAKRTAELVNYRLQGRFYVVDRLFDRAELRLGLKHQDIVRISRIGAPSKRRRAS